MSGLWRWLKRLVALAVVLALALLAPVAWVEMAAAARRWREDHVPLIADPAWQRGESRTYTDLSRVAHRLCLSRTTPR